MVENSTVAKFENLKSMLSNYMLSIALFFPSFSTPNIFDRLIKPNLIKYRGNNRDRFIIEYPPEFKEATYKYKSLSYSGLGLRYSTDIFNKENYDENLDTEIYRDYSRLVSDVGLAQYDQDTIYNILSEYYTSKLVNRTYDFSDMSFLCHTLMAQFPDYLAKIQNIYDYVICDECQDSPPCQISLLICLQNDVYNEFFAPLNIHLDKDTPIKPSTYKPLHQVIQDNGGIMTVSFDSDILKGL